MKKSGRTTKKAGKPRGNVKTTNVATRNPTSRAELNTLGIFDSWIDYSKQVENQVVDVLEENKTQYERLYSGWKDFSKSMGVRMQTSVGEDSPEYKELFNVWKNYSNKMGTRLNKMAQENRDNVENLTHKYRE